MSRFSRALLALPSLLLLGACVTTKATRLGTGAIRPMVPEQQVAIYRSAAQVPACYEEVALLTSSGDASMTDEEKMFSSMRKKASEVGANGVILDAVTEPGTGAKVANVLLGTSANRKGKALAIFVFPTDSEEAKRCVRPPPALELQVSASGSQ